MTIVTYQFDLPAVDLILKGLSHLPYREVAPAIERIAAIAHEAQQPPAKKKRVRKPAKEQGAA
jgi:hypothetical protein